MQAPQPIRFWGLLARFETEDAVLGAAEKVHAQGYRRTDAYSPYPVHGLAEAIGFKKTLVPLITLCGGVAGALMGFGMQYWISAIDYPLNIGGRPFNSWPQFIPVTFEMTILFAALSAVLGMLALNGLPRPHHPVFNAPIFKLASRDRFFIAIKGDDPLFDRVQTRQFLESLGGVVVEVDDDD
jgi:hypothetical protein